MSRKHKNEEECHRLRSTISAVARKERNAKKLTQADIGERIGRSSDFYSRIERGECLPSVATLARMATVLGVEADTLLGYKPADRPANAPAGGREDVSMDPPELRRLHRLLRNARPTTLRVASWLLDTLDPQAR